ncbi:MAG: hypothetical protein AAF772_17230 [Acidobacteriota bacterium]
MPIECSAQMWLIILLGSWMHAASAEAQQPANPWETELARVERALIEDASDKAARKATKLAKRISREAWHDPTLGATLARIAVVRAVTAHRGDDLDRALWWWHAALQLDARQARASTAAHAEADAFLREFSARTPKQRSRLRDGARPKLGLVAPPVLRARPPTLLRNDGATSARIREARVEVIADRFGQLHQPVVLEPRPHPLLIYAVLEWLIDLRAQPAEILDSASGRTEAAAALLDVEISLDARRR